MNWNFVEKSGISSLYFKYKKVACQGDPISVYFFILVLETVFCVGNLNKNVKGLNIFYDKFLYTAYADDATF